MTARLINLTDSEVTFLTKNGAVTIEPEGFTPRVVVIAHGDGEVNGIPVALTHSTTVVGLPERLPGTMYIVPKDVAEHAKDRGDLLVPDDLVYDDSGRVVGARRLTRLTPMRAEYVLRFDGGSDSIMATDLHEALLKAKQALQARGLEDGLITDPENADWIVVAD